MLSSNQIAWLELSYMAGTILYYCLLDVWIRTGSQTGRQLINCRSPLMSLQPQTKRKQVGFWKEKLPFACIVSWPLNPVPPVLIVYAPHVHQLTTHLLFKNKQRQLPQESQSKQARPSVSTEPLQINSRCPPLNHSFSLSSTVPLSFPPLFSSVFLSEIPGGLDCSWRSWFGRMRSLSRVRSLRISFLSRRHSPLTNLSRTFTSIRDETLGPHGRLT